MKSFLDFWAANAIGVSVFLLFMVVTVALFVWAIRKLSTTFGWGRYGADDGLFVGRLAGNSPSESSLGRLVTEFFMKIISEFRHFLALLIFILFAFVLIYAVIFTSQGPLGVANPTLHDRLDEMGKIIQVIVASLGGLVGSIIGYYFGEAGKAASSGTGSGSGASGGGGTGGTGAPPTPSQSTVPAPGVTAAQAPPQQPGP
jgi:hypothetical protein